MFNEAETPAVTRIIFKEEARKRLFEGLELAAEAVAVTLGPRGKTVLIQRKDQSPLVTKDGITVSRSVRLKDPVRKMGAELLREAAGQTNETAGDGTTTATVLTHAMVKEGLKLLDAGYPAKELCEGIERARRRVAAELVESAKKLSTPEEIAQVGTISSNGDSQIGALIAEAMGKVGRDGIITVEDAKGMSTTLELVEGMQFDRGYLSPYFVTNPERMTVAYENARVLLTDRKVSNMNEIVPVLEKLVRSRQPLIIIAEDVDGVALQGLVVNRVNGGLQVVAVKAPGYGKHRDELLSDIAVLTGARVASASTGLKLEDLTLEDLGTVKRVVVDAKATTLVGTGGNQASIDSHVKNLQAQLADVTASVEEVTKLKVRIAKLASGVAVIRVGGATETEMVERKYRVEDALNATRAAVEEGIVPGGGQALVNAFNMLGGDKCDRIEKHLEAGASIVMKSCLAPLRRIVQNAGGSPDVVLADLSRNPGKGYNAATEAYEDLIVSGVIDPVKVTLTALKNAASVAVTFLSLDAIIVEEENDKAGTLPVAQ